MSTSPAVMPEPSTMADFSATPTANPARSYSSSSYMPGISAVSPPIRPASDCTHPSATPETTCSSSAGSFLPQAM
jgi:hypothetical protein